MKPSATYHGAPVAAAQTAAAKLPANAKKPSTIPTMLSRAVKRTVGLPQTGGWVQTASGDEVFVGVALFKDLNGDWKWFKRGRDAWALYVAEVILRPQEVWRLRRGGDEQLYLLGRFARGSAIIEAIAVFRRDGHRRWSAGVTAFVADDKSAEYLKDKRRWLMKQAAFVRYLEV